jgi:hypothetical protein
MVLGLLPLGALVTALARSGPVRLRDLSSWAGACFGRYAVLLAMSLACAGFCVLMCSLVGGALGVAPMDMPRTHADVVGIAIVYAAIAACLVLVGVVHDLARASVVVHDSDVWSAIARAGAALRARPIVLLSGWALRAGLGVLLVAAALALGLATSRWLVALALLDQIVALLLVALRASWLALALNTVGEAQATRGSPVLA